MIVLNTFDAILQDVTQDQAIDYARGMVWCEVETTEQEIHHSYPIAFIDDVGVFYNYGADYYFFTDATNDSQKLCGETL